MGDGGGGYGGTTHQSQSSVQDNKSDAITPCTNIRCKHSKRSCRSIECDHYEHCKHEFVDTTTEIEKYRPFAGFYKAVKIVVYCKHCGKVTCSEESDWY